MSYIEIPSTCTRGRGRRGQGRGRGRGRTLLASPAAELDALQSVHLARQATETHIAKLSASSKEELLDRKRAKELHRVLLQQPPEDETIVIVVKEEGDGDCTPFPMPSTSYSEPIVENVPNVALEVDVTATPSTYKQLRQSAIRTTDSQFEQIAIDWLLDSDSDADIDLDDLPTEKMPPSNIDTYADSNLSPEQLEVLTAEDSTNDRVLRHFLPNDNISFDWNKDKLTFRGQRERFLETPGPTFSVDENTTPVDIFEKMFDVDFIDLLCVETNRYAEQKINLLESTASLTKGSRLHRWTPTDRPEMISFLALLIIQGLYPLPNEEFYFSFNGFGTMPYISRIMTYNRYRLLKSTLHFVNNDTLTLTPTSKLCKIQPIIDYFNTKFSSLYYPAREIAVDESLLKWSGRLSFAQKISSKAAKVGIKTYELCESSTGYLWRFSVYTGKREPATTSKDEVEQTEFRPTNATAKIVFDLLEPLLNRGHTVIMDNYYNCPLLARCLKKQKTDCYGTQRLNREFIPSSLKSLSKTDLRYGEIVATYCSDLSLMVWRDSNLVCMISTFHPLQIGAQNKHNKLTYKPTVILDYNKNMGGVDRKDQFLSAHPLERVKNRIWYKKLFQRFFNTAIFNCFTIYNSRNKINHRDFRTVLVESLLKVYRQIDLTTETRLIFRPPNKNRQTPTLIKRNSRLTMTNRTIVEEKHFPVKSEVRQGRCWWCTHKLKVTKRTNWKCLICQVNLCVGCFMDFHSS